MRKPKIKREMRLGESETGRHYVGLNPPLEDTTILWVNDDSPFTHAHVHPDGTQLIGIKANVFPSTKEFVDGASDLARRIGNIAAIVLNVQRLDEGSLFEEG